MSNLFVVLHLLLWFFVILSLFILVEMEEKRNRSANFTEEEKLKLLNLLQRHSEILSKRTDFLINKKKENAWLKLEQEFNSNNQIKRNVTSLKKIWNKLKYEAKTYRSKLKIDVTGTGGGPSTLKENNILELVLVLIGRAGVGIENIPDCDSPPESNKVIEMNVGPADPILIPVVQNELDSETFIISQVQDASSEAMEILTSQATEMQSASSSQMQITPASRRRPIIKASRKDQLEKEKVVTEKLKQNLMSQEMSHGVAKRAEEKELFELDKRKREQSIELRSIILRKLESNEDVDPALIQSIFKD